MACNHSLRQLSMSLVGLTFLLSGCVGTIRDTTTPRTATEQLLVSTAAKRAVQEYDASSLSGQRVFIDESHFESVDKAYVVSALRHHLAKAGAILTATPEADSVVEVRNASLGIWDGDFTMGLPPLPIEGLSGQAPLTLPPLYLVRRASQQSFAKLQLWVYQPESKAFVSKSPDLWGHAYYNQWYFFGLGPFDWSNDIYPDLIDYSTDE